MLFHCVVYCEGRAVNILRTSGLCLVSEYPPLQVACSGTYLPDSRVVSSNSREKCPAFLIKKLVEAPI